MKIHTMNTNLKIIQPTFDAIDELNSITDCTISSLNCIPQKNTLQKGNRELILSFKDVYNPDIDRAMRIFDLGDLSVTTNKRNYCIPSKSAFLSGSTGNLLSMSPDTFHLHIYHISSFSKTHSSSFIRMILPISNDNWIGELASEKFSVGNQSTVGLLNLDFPLGQVHAYSWLQSGQKYLIIEPQYKISVEEILNIQYAVSLGLGLLSGTAYLDECYIVSSKSIGFHKIEDIEYRRLRESIVSAYRLFTTNMYSIYQVLQKGNNNKYAATQIETTDGVLNPNYVDHLYPLFYNRLFTTIYQDEYLSRAAEIMLDASERSLGYQVSLYSIALETITTRLKSIYSVKYPGIIDKSSWKKLHSSLTKAFESISTELLFNKGIHDRYLRALDNMNNISNQEKFNLVMDAVGYARSSTDDDAITQRNMSLHGNLAKKTSPTSSVADDQFFYSTVLCRLCYSLLFKFCGFDSYIVNLPVLYDLEPACSQKEEVLLRIP